MIMKSSFDNIRGEQQQEEAVEGIAVHSPVTLQLIRDYTGDSLGY